MNHLPWVEKYRPDHFKDIILETHNRIILNSMLEENTIPNLLFYGPPGTGKTTTIINLIKTYQKNNNQEHKELIIHLNASDDRGIETIRNQINTFTNSTHLFNKGTKFIVLDEIDYMTKTAQTALYNLIKNNIENVRFFLICNYISKLEKCLQNSCMSFKFNSMPNNEIFTFLKNIVKCENLTSKVSDKDLNKIIHRFKSDVRSMINYLQSICDNNNKNLIISKEDIEKLINYLKTNKSKQECEKKFIHYLKYYNIEKHFLIVNIINYITENYELTNELIIFIQIVIRYENYYLEDFNKFFISKLVSLLND